MTVVTVRQSVPEGNGHILDITQAVQEAGALTLGTWQQIILVDFDTRPRSREFVVQMIGEA